MCDAIHILLPLVKDRYKFGICANIAPSELDVIMDRYSDPVQCLSNIIDLWHRKSWSQSWSTLAKVVEKMQNYEQVALSLKKKANKGKEPEYSETVDEQDLKTSVAAKLQERNTSDKVVKFKRGTDQDLKRNSKQQGFLQFKCAGAHCTIQDHFEGKKCSQHSKQYPYLDFRGEQYEMDIQIYLEEQTDKMRYSFATLMQDTRKHLQELLVTTPYSDIQGYVKLLVAGKAGYERIKNAKDLFELQDALIETCCSWFNHAIIGKIRKAFLHKNSPDQIMEEYLQEFEQYCKRRCFESPTVLHPETESSEEPEIQALVFKVELDFHSSTLTDILQVKRAVAKILGCPPHAINVCMVKEGCIEVQCYVLPIAAIRYLSDKQVTELQRLNISSFIVDTKDLLQVSRNAKNFIRYI